mmetsp:Transcript_17187/g.69136  ORF Transcript_17187/g.69136 Transcript_17187/m.69136 type:complete len:344 (-) Transcript_17187:531-1562(-)
MGRRGRDGAAEMRWERGEVVGEIEAVVDVGIPREVGDEAQVDHHERRRIARRDGAPVLVQRDDAACAIALGLRDEPERRARAGSIGGRRRGRCRGGDVGCEGREPEGGAVEHPRDAPQVFVAVRIPRPAPALLGRAAREPLEAVELPRDALLVDDEEARIEALDRDPVAGRVVRAAPRDEVRRDVVVVRAVVHGARARRRERRVRRAPQGRVRSIVASVEIRGALVVLVVATVAPAATAVAIVVAPRRGAVPRRLVAHAVPQHSVRREVVVRIREEQRARRARFVEQPVGRRDEPRVGVDPHDDAHRHGENRGDLGVAVAVVRLHGRVELVASDEARSSFVSR